MDLYLLFHSVLMHISAAIIILIYIPLSIPVKLFLWAFLKPLRKEDLKGKVVLITGASSGIGEELAYQYAKQGACLSLVARRKQALEGVAETARERGSPDVLVVPADVSDPEQSRRAVEETVAHFGKLNHLVANAGTWSICFFDEVTNITAFTKMMDVNFWGSVYPTYNALPHLKASKGKLIVSSSIAASAPTSRLSLYNASKAAQLRFYETLRSELGSEVGVTILTAGFVESEMTKGKAIQRDGQVAVDEEARDVQIGVFPVARVERLCEVALNGIRRGDWYVTWPSLYRPVPLIACLAPEVLTWQSYALYNAKKGSPPLSQRMLDATGAKRFYPPSLRNHPGIKTERTDDHKEDAASNV
ncbi:11-beta-hydroxysteroid dehydrogenase 1B [Dichanthelium oligosanthes]|uniref:11-beta-hydroxysteroid dehydrogenase 1B n=1 Tax=Dichanthelium oligosanthes TaxID=888268 RepID=A0A1E5VFP4_9POAL|nr:11-beta-hydroxysteroid dehydrogenase 1B [Dichanthelium oligosanthes]